MLMEALEGCDNLRVLELGYNPFGEEGIKAIADVMKYKLQVRHAIGKAPAILMQFTMQPKAVAVCYSHCCDGMLTNRLIAHAHGSRGCRWTR